MTAVVDIVRRVLANGPSVRLAVLFGSEATGAARSTSDVDVAFLPVDPDLPLSMELDLVGRLSSELGREVDLVRLDRASTLLRWEVARHGTVVTTTPPYEWTRFRARAASEHAEFAEALESAARLFRKPPRGGSVTDALIVLKKLAMLREHVARVRRRRPAAREAFEREVDVQDALSLSFLVAVQEANDIAMHIASDEGWGVPGSYAEAFELLARNSVITHDHARQLGAIASVRNRIAHGYASLDPGRLWDELPVGLDALDRFVVAIARICE